MGSKGKDTQGKTYDDRANQSIAEVKTVSPLEAWQTAQTKKWMDFNDGTGEYAGKARNITDAPGFSDVLDVYGTSKTATQNDRYGGGALNLASPSAGAYGDQQKQLNDFNFYNNRAEGISNAVHDLRAQNLGQADTLINRDFQRKNSAAGLDLTAQNNYYNRPQKQSFWEKLALAGVGAAGSVAGAYVGKP